MTTRTTPTAPPVPVDERAYEWLLDLATEDSAARFAADGDPAEGLKLLVASTWRRDPSAAAQLLAMIGAGLSARASSAQQVEVDKLVAWIVPHLEGVLDDREVRQLRKQAPPLIRALSGYLD